VLTLTEHDTGYRVDDPAGAITELYSHLRGLFRYSMAAMFLRDVSFEPMRPLTFVALVDQLIGAASDFSGLISIKLHPLTDSNGNRKGPLRETV